MVWAQATHDCLRKQAVAPLSSPGHGHARSLTSHSEELSIQRVEAPWLNGHSEYLSMHRQLPVGPAHGPTLWTKIARLLVPFSQRALTLSLQQTEILLRVEISSRRLFTASRSIGTNGIEIRNSSQRRVHVHRKRPDG